jgi:hypothetical protein
MDIKKTPKKPEFYCKYCQFETGNKKDYSRHVLTAKHQKQQKRYENDIILPQKTPYAECSECHCGKIYKHYSGLWRHQLKCLPSTNVERAGVQSHELANAFTPTTPSTPFGNYGVQTLTYASGSTQNTETFANATISGDYSTLGQNPTPSVPASLQTPSTVLHTSSEFTRFPTTVVSGNLHTIMFELLQQNQDFKELLVDQNEKMIELNKQNHEQNKTIIELASKVGNTNTTNIKNQNNFNLQVFLNETCKDAINITDFIKELHVSFSQLENIGQNGYVAGITDVILTQLKRMDITKRPLHCTDLKRDTMYIKETNEWVKDDNENTKMTQIFRNIANNNMKTIKNWCQDNPNCKILDTKENKFCMDVMLNSLGAIGDMQVKYDNKVLKTIAKYVHVDRNI